MTSTTVEIGRGRAAWWLLVPVGFVIGRVLLPSVWAAPAVAAWATVFVAICLQATPFVVLGVLVSTLVTAVPARALLRWLGRHPWLAVPTATVAGVALPGCECGSVPVAAGLRARGVPPGAAVAFMVAAPALNPVVLVATAVAYPGQPLMVIARAVAAALLAVAIGCWWQARDGTGGIAAGRSVAHEAHDISARIIGAARELGRSLGLVTAGASAAATLIVFVPPDVLARLGSNGLFGVGALAVLAVLLAVCSTADAFVASAFTTFSTTAQLTFLVVGPAVDVKVAAMQVGTFGVRFVRRFVPVAFGLAVLVAVGVAAAVW